MSCIFQIYCYWDISLSCDNPFYLFSISSGCLNFIKNIVEQGVAKIAEDKMSEAHPI